MSASFTDRYYRSEPGTTRRCDGSARYAIQCRRFGPADENGRYFCHDHADQAERMTRTLDLWAAELDTDAPL